MKTVALFASTLLVALGLAGCGGGGGDAASTLSATQRNYKSSAVNNTYSGFVWNLPTTNIAPTNGTHYFASTSYALNGSPEEGAQAIQYSADNLTTSLTMPSVSLSAQRYLKNSAFYVSRIDSKADVTFVGDNVRVKRYATDDLTVVSETEFDSWSESISLTGTLADTDVLRQFYGFARLNNSTYFIRTTPWRAGSSYVTRKRTVLNEVIELIDWNTRTYDANVDPWSGTQTTLETMFTYVDTTFGGVTVNGVTYQFGDGAITSKQGVRMWVATTKQPAAKSPTDSYICFMELNGKIYLGKVTPANTREKVLDGIDSTQVLDYTIRFNSTAVSSIKDAVNF